MNKEILRKDKMSPQTKEEAEKQLHYDCFLDISNSSALSPLTKGCGACQDKYKAIVTKNAKSEKSPTERKNALLEKENADLKELKLTVDKLIAIYFHLHMHATQYTQSQLKQAYSMVTQDLFQRLVKAKDQEPIRFGKLGSFKKSENQTTSYLHDDQGQRLIMVKLDNFNQQSSPPTGFNQTNPSQFSNSQNQTQSQFSEPNQSTQQPAPKAMSGQKIPALGGTMAEMQASLQQIQFSLSQLLNSQQQLSTRLQSLETNASQQLTNLSQQFANANKSFHLLATETKRSLEFNPRPTSPEREQNSYEETEY
ncbi:19799_t:CDS:2 [Racocetra persica]|uniref:19799_t:CDS:1 n=1 Tax=Racocetra persica TaxID=160502 RepID=A0ACA9P2B4_9GLOM|nr:19799_t:CDS:2 [Racocetra persica]